MGIFSFFGDILKGVAIRIITYLIVVILIYFLIKHFIGIDLISILK